MSQTIKIIDLFNKIANGEEAPKKIIIAGHRYKYNTRTKDYDSDIGMNNYDLFLHIGILKELNTEIKIIEEDEDINIQDIEELPEYIHIGDGGADADVKDEVNIKINEIIRAVKHLEKTKEDK
jgi:hypothetical protein